MIDPRISVSSICFLDKSLSEQARYWQQLGNAQVGLVGMQVDSLGLDACKTLLKRAGVQVATFMHPLLAVGENLETLKGNYQPVRKQLQQRIDEAVELGSPSIYMVTGGRGKLSWQQAADTFTEIITPCVEYAEQNQLRLMIENAPPAYADIHIAHSLHDSLKLIKQANIGLCLDLPGCWTEADIDQLIVEAIPYCGLVQISDYVCGDRCLPARAVPGDGHMPLNHLVSTLLAAGYQGAFDLELIGPRIDEEGQLAATQRATLKLTEILAQYSP